MQGGTQQAINRKDLGHKILQSYPTALYSSTWLAVSSASWNVTVIKEIMETCSCNNTGLQ